ncbi:MAG: hypothetical protein AB7N76_32845 [Planctomycetota bacterium]
MLALVASALVLCAALRTTAGERRDEPRVVELIAPGKGFRVTDRLLFVVDVSGSMAGEGERAISAVRRVLEVPTDDLQAGVIAFADAPRRWRGVPEPCRHPASEAHGRRCVLPGWAAFPGRTKELYAWLRGFRGDGGTNAASALRVALLDRNELLTVVLVSDGAFDADLAVSAWKVGQEVRKRRGLPPAGLMLWGAGWGARETEALGALARASGGGLWVERQEEPEGAAH